MKKIDISTKTYPNTFALVDDKDYEWLSMYHWYTNKREGGKLYAARNVCGGGKQKKEVMHIAIMGYSEGEEVDHKNGNTLDNQRLNLRHCTHAENSRNRLNSKNSTSGYKGVGWHKIGKKWQARIGYNNKRKHLGLFFCLVKAAKCYDKAATELFGEFANLNFKKASN